MSTPTYLRGMFLKKLEGVSAQGEPYEFFKMAIKRDALVEHLGELEADENGFVNFKVNPQKGDPSKYSTALDTWKPHPPINKSAAVNKPAYSARPAGEKDSLPF